MLFPGFGTLINATVMIITGSLGVLLGSKIPERVRETSLMGLGLITIMIGVDAFLETSNAIIPLISILLGGITGSLIQIEHKLETIGEWLKKKTYSSKNNINSKTQNFVEGFVVASLIACVGPLAILAPLNEVVSKDLNLIFVKTGLDGIMVFVYSGTMGIGVLFSSLSVIVVQGFFTFLSVIIGNTFLNEQMITELTSTGGLMILSIAFRLLNIKKIPSADLIPGLIYAPLVVLILNQF